MSERLVMQILQSAIWAAGMAGTFALLRRLLPVSTGADEAPADRAELERRYGGLYRGTSLAVLLLGAGFTAPVYVGLRALADAWPRRLGPSEFLLTPPAPYWLCIALFAGLLASTLACDLFCRARLGPRYRDLVRYINLTQGYDNERLGRVMAPGIALVCALGVCAGLGCYTRFSREGFAENGFWSVGERAYPWSALRSVRLVVQPPAGDRPAGEQLTLRFADGFEWRSHGNLADPGPTRAMARFAAARAGVPVEEPDAPSR